MRVCFFSPYIDKADFDQRRWLQKIGRVVGGDRVEAMFLTSYPSDSLDEAHVYVVAGGRKLEMRLCRKWLRIMDSNGWIPSFLGLLPIRFCQSEILEGLLGCDPDVIVSLDVQWCKQLKKLIRRKYPHWICLTREEEPPAINSAWRRYNAGAKVSIVLPTYNGSKNIRQSIESCLGQTHRNLELVVVDDGSSDDIFGILSTYNDPRIKYFRHRNNLGLAEALNTGFRSSTGEYLSWTSDDNYYAANAIEEMVRFLQTYPEVDFVYADWYGIDEKSTDQGPRILKNEPPDSLKVDNFIGACYLYKKEVYETVGEYNPRTSLLEDYDYWIRVWKQFRMQRLFRPLYYYRFHQDSLTSKHSPAEIAEKVKLVKQLNRLRKFATRFYPTACI